MSTMGRTVYKAAEFFAGIGLVRLALEKEGFSVVFANDIERSKWKMYGEHFGYSPDFVLGDVRNIKGKSIPDVDVATASFPCTDLSLAGNRAGLNGKESSMFWEFARILDEMGKRRRPKVVLLENVVGFATSHGGRDVASAIEKLNEFGYVCDMFTIDARIFVPQSRPRLFIVGTQHQHEIDEQEIEPSWLRPSWIHNFKKSHRTLSMQFLPLKAPKQREHLLSECVERFGPNHPLWWEGERLAGFLNTLSLIQAERLAGLRATPKLTWATAYRRTRKGRPMWEIRADAISGCLRTARGGSGKQALVEAGRGNVRVRWMTPMEYARLQGAPDFKLDGARRNDAISAFGDGVCVPVIAWIAREYLKPVLENSVADVVSQEKRLALAHSLP